MKKNYSAEEMRDAILELKAFQDDKKTLLRIEDMLRQAADALEREKTYEYTAVYIQRRSGKIISKCAYHFDSFEIAKRHKYYPLKYEKLRFVRRSVGEWEEVPTNA